LQKYLYVAMVGGLALLAIEGCNSGPTLDGVSATAEQRKFSSISSTILVPKCAMCHAPEGARAGVVVTSYEDLMSSPGAVVPFSPLASQLYRQCLSGEMPRDMPHLSSLELRMIYDWISYGAKND
jgi:uncharacterized membrane protein